MAYIYAIVKNEGSNTLSKISEYICSYGNIYETELCKYHNYSTNLCRQYCSCLPSILSNRNLLASSRQKRMDAVNFERATNEMYNKYGDRIVAMSHRKGGWTGINWEFNDDISFIIGTNFGYGMSSYFYATFKYKDCVLAPYSFYVKYRYSNYASVVRCTYDYPVEYEQWDKVMSDCLSFYNAIVFNNEHYVFSWLNDQLSVMVSGLEQFVYSTSANFGESSIDRCHQSGYTTIFGDDFWIIKSEKIAFSLDFIENISKLPMQVNPTIYIQRISTLCQNFQPLLQKKIDCTDKLLAKQKAELFDLLQNDDYKLYDRIHSKFYYKRGWYLSDKKWGMLRFLVGLKNMYAISRNDARKRYSILKHILSEKNRMESEISATEFLYKSLVKDDDRISTYFEDNIER